MRCKSINRKLFSYSYVPSLRQLYRWDEQIENVVSRLDKLKFGYDNWVALLVRMKNQITNNFIYFHHVYILVYALIFLEFLELGLLPHRERGNTGNIHRQVFTN
jgi:hypothetical protein